MTEPVKAGLIGHVLSASLTPEMHQVEAQAQNFAYHYIRIDTAEPEHHGKPLETLLIEAEAAGFSGVNVTHPFKTEAAVFCNTLSDTAQALGAVNTLLFKDGKRQGHNTDYIGFRSALRDAAMLGSIHNILLLGAGGAGAAVALALIDQGCAKLTLCDPALGRADELRLTLAQLRPQTKIAAVRSPAEVDLTGLNGVVNASPLGMDAHPGMAIDPAGLKPGTWVTDIVYMPIDTALLRAARACGLTTLNGTAMAIYQAVAAFQLITGRCADAQRLRTHFHRLSGSDAFTPTLHTPKVMAVD